MQACGVIVCMRLRPVLLVAGRTRGDSLRNNRGAPGREPELPGDRVRRDGHTSGKQCASSGVLPGLPRQSDLRPRAAARRRLARSVRGRYRPPQRNDGVLRPARPHQAGQKKKLVQLELLHGTSHTTHTDKPDDYEESSFESSIITLDPNQVFKLPPEKGAREMTYAELRQAIAQAAAHKDPAYEARFMIQQKTSLPMACPILALIGLALGANNRKDGKLGSFVIGIAVIFIYYVLLWGARATAMGGRFSPEWAPWIPNIVMGMGGLVMVAWRARLGDQPLRLSLPSFRRRKDADLVSEPGAVTARPRGARSARRLPRLNFLLPRVLDVYISREYLRLIVIGLVGLLALFYISTFIDLADKLFRGETTGIMLARYFYFRTPQFVYYVIPMAVLVSTLVTVGLFTKNSELLVMRACGISLYRAALPLLICGVLASGVLFAMQERVLVSSNREADKLERTIRHWPEATTALNRRWMVGTGGEMYHYDFFDQRSNRFTNLLVYRLDERGVATSRGHPRERRAVHSAGDARPERPHLAGPRRVDAGDPGRTRQRGRSGSEIRNVCRAGTEPRAGFVFQDRRADRGLDDLRTIERLHRSPERQRRERRPSTCGARTESCLSVRDGHHDHPRGAIRRLHRTPRRDVRRRHRHRPRDHLHRRAQHLRCPRRGRRLASPPRRVGAEHALRRRSRLYGADRPYVGHEETVGWALCGQLIVPT